MSTKADFRAQVSRIAHLGRIIDSNSATTEEFMKFWAAVAAFAPHIDEAERVLGEPMPGVRELISRFTGRSSN